MSQRTKNYLAQLKGSVAFKGLGVTASFLLTPILLKYLGVEKFGVWSTMLSIFSWIVFFDLGVSNGTRNKTAEALAIKDYKLANAVVSTSYICVSLLSGGMYLVLLSFSSFINWQQLFNSNIVSNYELKYSVLIAGFFVLLNFVLSIVKQVIHSVQKTALVVFEQFSSNFLALIFTYVASKFFSSNLIILSLVYGLAITISCCFLSFWFYKSHSYLIPKFSNFDRKVVKNILGLGLKFFFVQVSFLVIFTTNKMIIAQLFGPEEVTPFDILFKLFSVVTIAHSIIITPLWSAFTEAYAKKDIKWVSNIINRLVFLMIPFVMAICALAIFASSIVEVWMGQAIHIDLSLAVLVGAFVAISIWSNIYAYFLNGINAINLQLYCMAAGGFINVPLSIFLGKYLSLGVKGVVLSSILSLGIFAIIGPIQTFSIIKREKLQAGNV